MAYVTQTSTSAVIFATTDDGVRFALDGKISSNNIYYPVFELTERINLQNLFTALGTVAKSPQDLLILGRLLSDLNILNELVLPNISKFAESFGVSRSTVNSLLDRAVDTDLIYKLDTGRYLVNPFRIMGTGATAAGYAQQELVQVRWKELTGLLTELDITQLLALSKHLGLPYGLPGTNFNLSVAQYYASKQLITPKQRTALTKRGVIAKDSK
jgi:hypothetical protein